MLQAVAHHGGVGQLGQLVAHDVVHALVNIDTLGRDADLAGVLHGCAIDLGRRGDGVHIIQHDQGVVAAELQRDPLQGVGGAGHHFLAGLGGAGEADLTDVRVLGHLAAQVVGVGDHVQHAGRDQILHQFGEPQRGERGGCGRLQDHGVAGQERGGHLEGHQDQREVPGHDGPHDAERSATNFDPCIGRIGHHLRRQVEAGEIAEEGRSAEDLAHGVLQRLALFLGQQARQLGYIGLDRVGHGHQDGATLVHAGL